MAIKIGAAQLARLRQTMGRASARGAAIAKKGEKTVTALVRTAEVSGAAFALGVAQGKLGSVEILGVPADLAGGVALHAAGFFGLGGNKSGHLHSFADGCLATYFNNLGKGTGLSWKGKALPGKTETKGAEGQKLTAGELDALSK
jgi:hypothetical protein